jgi:hypothetical protein
VGFEPTVRVTVHTLSKRAHSAALTPLQWKCSEQINIKLDFGARLKLAQREALRYIFSLILIVEYCHVLFETLLFLFNYY